MALKIQFKKHILQFKFEAGTSRGTLKTKTTYFIIIHDTQTGITGIGECGPLKGLSIDDRDDMEEILADFCTEFEQTSWPIEKEEALEIIAEKVPAELPAVRFGFETAFLDLINGGKRLLFENDFSLSKESIPINGLIWMGDKDFMSAQIEQKLEAGFDCLKMKIGAIDFEQECKLLNHIRKNYSSNEITLRVDANGAFKADEATERLKKLAAYDIHSIEQPIWPGQVEAMKVLCDRNIIPIALDEELIGVHGNENKKILLENIRPQFIILKPTLLGGFKETREWIHLAEALNIGWWITSALESNIGLNAIAQFTAQFNTNMLQGLGTGQLYHNNIPSPLIIEKGFLKYDEDASWNTGLIFNSN
ncbi:o-succinylbenzoate synthase [Fulvivirgaceae bacterium BMA10]|uniref:O-succinylbenzoate synthase n=1 Tax=Splendidivirga corallicola TaxID=3051826 RepID=A0ABT8KR56_9BACT|nr:o-succinylbenzoate synthase [Fulvivirgaceae bacterium BMA10]